MQTCNYCGVRYNENYYNSDNCCCQWHDVSARKSVKKDAIKLYLDRTKHFSPKDAIYELERIGDRVPKDCFRALFDILNKNETNTLTALALPKIYQRPWIASYKYILATIREECLETYIKNIYISSTIGGRVTEQLFNELMNEGFNECIKERSDLINAKLVELKLKGEI